MNFCTKCNEKIIAIYYEVGKDEKVCGACFEELKQKLFDKVTKDDLFKNLPKDFARFLLKNSDKIPEGYNKEKYLKDDLTVAIRRNRKV